jgi:cutinase
MTGLPLQGTVIGPEVGRRLKVAFGSNNVAVQGVDYAALLITNFSPGGADPAGIAKLKSLLNTAVPQCPNSKIVVGGYR